MKKIIHLSDIHVGHEDCGVKFNTIIGNIIMQQQPASDYVIVITGDIVENANHTEYVDEAIKTITKLESSGFKVLVVPGNHDYGNGALGKKRLVKPFKEKYYQNPEITYPKLDFIDEIAFIGLDSNAAELHLHDRFFCEGELGKKQLSGLKEILEKPEVVCRKKVVYMHHHPFDYKPMMQLKDYEKLKEIIENKVDMLLFGHYHNDSESVNKVYHGTWGIPRCYNGGSSTYKNGDLGFHRIIDLSGSNHSADYDGRFL